ncbi:MAG: hypothetical protein CMP23_02870 [Rickettsiales bacterium]|nr:hypothetical protein [Rickettsiales bacterium]|tara:strand:- start:514 stop:1695 length:1182 start_codon:yes stop_codon:yes gene_type:complete
MRRATVLVGGLTALFSVLLQANGAQADICEEFSYGMPQGPVTAALNDGQLGAARRTCPRSEIGIDGGASLLVDSFNFYGHILAGFAVDGSMALGSKGELFGRLEFLRYQTAITPTPASQIGLGHSSFGGTWRFLIRKQGSLALTGKAALPTAFGLYQNAFPIGLDIGLSAMGSPRKGVSFHAQVGVITSAALTRGDPMPQIGAVVTAGLALQPRPSFALVADLHGNFGYRGPVDVFAGAVALRFSDRKRFGFEVGATLPILGIERSIMRLDLRASIRLGPYRPAQAQSKTTEETTNPATAPTEDKSAPPATESADSGATPPAAEPESSAGPSAAGQTESPATQQPQPQPLSDQDAAPDAMEDSDTPDDRNDEAAQDSPAAPDSQDEEEVSGEP